MARKSLIAPGSFLPESGATAVGEPGLLEGIIQKDRQKHRPAPPASTVREEVLDTERQPEYAGLAALHVTNVTTLQPSNEEANDTSNVPSNLGSNERTIEPSNHAAHASANAASSAMPIELSAAASTRLSRLDRATTISREDEQADEIAVVTVRVSARLAAYMDRYVARINQVQPKGRYRKQDAVAEAFAAFYADHPMPPEPAQEI